MAESLTIARPYAEDAFKAALEHNALPAWSDALTRLAAVARTPEASARPPRASRGAVPQAQAGERVRWVSLSVLSRRWSSRIWMIRERTCICRLARLL